MSSVNILQTVTDRQTLPLPTLKIAAYIHLTLKYFKGQGQGRAHFDSEYRADGGRWCKHCYYKKIENCMRPFHWHIYVLTMSQSKGKSHAISTEYIATDDR